MQKGSANIFTVTKFVSKTIGNTYRSRSRSISNFRFVEVKYNKLPISLPLRLLTTMSNIESNQKKNDADDSPKQAKSNESIKSKSNEDTKRSSHSDTEGKKSIIEEMETEVHEDKSNSKTELYSIKDPKANRRYISALEEKETILNLDIETKRRLYKCKSNYTQLKDVKSWPDYFIEENITSAPGDRLEGVEVREDWNQKLSLFCGDITTLEIDAIVNAANESLLGGGGVDGAIHTAAGPILVDECRGLGGCDAGEAKLTGGFKLPAKYIIHTVGPRRKDPDKLELCYKNCLSILKEHKLKSIAFPCISTGIFGYPNEDAAKVALGTIRGWLEEEEYAKEVDRIIMCLFLKKDKDIYHKLMQSYFPLAEKTIQEQRAEENKDDEQGEFQPDAASSPGGTDITDVTPDAAQDKDGTADAGTDGKTEPGATPSPSGGKDVFGGSVTLIKSPHGSQDT
ncbi:ADP-ribose glycohydrolase MACROD1-like isoform X2 [Physella acuta]|uniref:ADP-ribose glycohydrolase MACROD1-like isoform X2 n=1 Tax=Physella acuta TaxID=109671 RepID=UPI0027DDA742|nr:ADP-ribose glycohydrolase MACROD1-like isoform X2 [Physella acuta]